MDTDFNSKLSEFTESVTNGVKDAIATTANAIAKEAKQNTSGDIAGSISTEIGDDGLSATVSSNSPNAAATEYGHNSKAFLNPAFESQAPAFLNRLQEVISN